MVAGISVHAPADPDQCKKLRARTATAVADMCSKPKAEMAMAMAGALADKKKDGPPAKGTKMEKLGWGVMLREVVVPSLPPILACGVSVNSGLGGNRVQKGGMSVNDWCSGCLIILHPQVKEPNRVWQSTTNTLSEMSRPLLSVSNRPATQRTYPRKTRTYSNLNAF